MTAYDRRRLLRDMGLLTASLAAPWPIACKCTACTNLYIILEGPWLLSITHPLYMRAITTRMGSQDTTATPISSKYQTGTHASQQQRATTPVVPQHCYDYFDPRIPTDEGCHRPMGSCRMTHLDVRPHCNKLLSQAKRDALFQAMYDQAQGIFYTSDVKCPDTFDCSKNTLELLLSYPDEIIPMGLHSGITFSSLECAKTGKVKQWPSALLLRYKHWESGVFYGDQCEQESLHPSSREVHRKISVAFKMKQNIPPTCADYGAAAKNGLNHFCQVRGLLQVASGKRLPVPTYPPCTGDPKDVKDNITGQDHYPITEDELRATYSPETETPAYPSNNHATDLVNCAAGGGGIVGHGGHG